MTDDKIKEEFEKWLRTYCFQSPPPRDYELMKDTFMECAKIVERIAKSEVLGYLEKKLIIEGSSSRGITDEIADMIYDLKEGR
jgi:hypothetical protein